MRRNNGHQFLVIKILTFRSHPVIESATCIWARTECNRLTDGFRTIPVVKDDEIFWQSAVATLDSLGYRTILAGDRKQAMIVLCREDDGIDLALTDYVTRPRRRRTGVDDANAPAESESAPAPPATRGAQERMRPQTAYSRSP